MDKKRGDGEHYRIAYTHTTDGRKLVAMKVFDDGDIDYYDIDMSASEADAEVLEDEKEVKNEVR